MTRPPFSVVGLIGVASAAIGLMIPAVGDEPRVCFLELGTWSGWGLLLLVVICAILVGARRFAWLVATGAANALLLGTLCLEIGTNTFSLHWRAPLLVLTGELWQLAVGFQYIYFNRRIGVAIERDAAAQVGLKTTSLAMFGAGLLAMGMMAPFTDRKLTWFWEGMTLQQNYLQFGLWAGGTILFLACLSAYYVGSGRLQCLLLTGVASLIFLLVHFGYELRNHFIAFEKSQPIRHRFPEFAPGITSAVSHETRLHWLGWSLLFGGSLLMIVGGIIARNARVLEQSKRQAEHS